MQNDICEDIILTTLKDHPEKYQETISLIEKSFNYLADHKFDVDFYPLMNKKNHHHNYLLLSKVDESVVGHIGVNLRQFQSRGNSTMTGLVGGVVLREDFQRKGIMNLFLKKVLSLHHNNVSLFLLWSDLDKFYKKFNFHQAGGIIQTSQPNNNIFPPLDYHHKSQLSKTELLQIKKIYNLSFNNFTTLKRGEKDWQNIFNITSSKLYIKKNNENEISAYFFYEKGHDFKNIIHEFGSLKKDYLPNIKELANYCLWLPESQDLNYPTGTHFYGGLFKVGSSYLFSEFIHNWSQNKIAIIDISPDFIIFNFSGSEYTMTHANFLESIFGPNSIKEFKLLGLPLYISGLDSV